MEEILTMSQQTNVSFYNLAGTKGDRLMTNQTPDLAWGQPYGNDLK